jgi:hypothetical protein
VNGLARVVLRFSGCILRLEAQRCERAKQRVRSSGGALAASYAGGAGKRLELGCRWRHAQTPDARSAAVYRTSSAASTPRGTDRYPTTSIREVGRKMSFGGAYPELQRRCREGTRLPTPRLFQSRLFFSIPINVPTRIAGQCGRVVLLCESFAFATFAQAHAPVVILQSRFSVGPIEASPIVQRYVDVTTCWRSPLRRSFFV